MKIKNNNFLPIIAMLSLIIATTMSISTAEIIEPDSDKENNTTITIIGESSYKDKQQLVDNEILEESTGSNLDFDSELVEKYSQFKTINSDVVGYIRIRNSNLNFPFLQQSQICSEHNIIDNCYYEFRDIYGRSAINSTAISFVDGRNNITENIEDFDQNTIIYGHTWGNNEKNGKTTRIGDPNDKQFDQLVSYTDWDWFNSHLVLEMNTGNENSYWIPQFVVYTDATMDGYPKGFDYFKMTLNEDDINKLYDRSVIVNPDKVNLDTDKLLTLSTCNYKYSNSKVNRFVVVFKYIEDSTYNDALETAKSIAYESHNNIVDWV